MRLRTCTLLLCMFWVGIVAAQKQLYGLTRGESGSLIEHITGAATVTVKHQFTEGALPWYNNLMQAKDGKLYGMTKSGGAYDKGTIFSFDPASNEFNKIFDFDGAKGAMPFGSFIQAKDGKLYGMTESGGAYDKGTIFSFDLAKAEEKHRVLYSFDGANGRSPYGSLLEASNGKLYGVTESGGLNDFGTIFSFDPDEADVTRQFSLLYQFSLTDGRSPYGGLIEISNTLYGTAQFGGANGYGVLFSVSLAGSFKKEVDFNWTNGAWPNSTLTYDGRQLYGTSETGGSNNYGVIYSYTPGATTISPLFEFDGVNGRSPYGKLLKTSDNLLYGMTFRGGAEDKGVLYSIAPGASTITSTINFTGANGMNPAASLVEYTPPKPLPLTLISFTAKEVENKVQLYWNVESEFDIKQYEVERSTDGLNFIQIGTVTAVNRESLHQYNYSDLQPASGKNYYRLKIIERYKAPHYSEVKMISKGKSTFNITVQPNPITAGSSIYISLQGRSRVQITLYNAQGAMIKQWPATTLDKGGHYLPLNMADVPGGSYILVVEGGKSKHSLQLFKGTKN